MPLAVHHFPARPSDRREHGPTPPPVVLLHSFASSAAEDFLETGWPETLGAAGRDVIAIDLPAHGASPGITDPAQATPPAVVSSILEAIGEVSPSGDIDVVAYSLGARLAWELPGASPRVRRLVLGGISPADPFAAIEAPALADALEGIEPATPLVGFIAAMISAPGRDTASLAALVAGLGSEPFAPEHAGPRVPTLLIAGDADEVASGIDELATGLERAELAFVPGDHRAALDGDPIRVAALEFLAR